MDMELVQIPKLSSLFTECTWLEPYWWYSRLLQDHVAEGGRVEGLSVPDFVLQSISYGQKNSAFVSPDMKRIICGIADIACVVGTAKDTRLLRKMSVQPNKTFTDDEMTQLRSLSKELQFEVKRYNKVILKLQKQQKKCWDLSKIAAKKRAAVYYDRRHGGPTAEKQYQQFLAAYEELLKQLTLFMEIKDNGETIKGQMTEISTNIKSLVVTAISQKTKDAIENLMSIIQAADTSLPTTHIAENLLQVNHNRLANAIFNITSEMYHYPNIEDYKHYPGFTMAIPNSNRKTEPVDPVTVRVPKRKMCCKQGNEYRLISRTIEETLPGFLEAKKDLKVKQKITLMEGTIAYGWARFSKVSPRKTWGYVHIQ